MNINKVASAKVEPNNLYKIEQINEHNLFYFFMNKIVKWKMVEDYDLNPSDKDFKQ